MKRRAPAVPDFALWAKVAERVRPLRPRRPEASRPEQPTETRLEPESNRHRSGPVRIRSRPAPAAPPPLTGLDRQTRRRLMRGAADIEAVLDLHGETVTTAHAKLQGFIGRARRDGKRLVLVITGKGRSPFTGHMLHGADPYHVPEREGRIRRLVTEWLGEPEFRQHVAGFQPAHPKHGGGGAFYVRLRRMR